MWKECGQQAVTRGEELIVPERYVDQIHNAFGVQEPTKIRKISHLSYKNLESVRASFQLPLLALLTLIPVLCWIIILDIKSAFYNLPLDPLFWAQFGTRWKTELGNFVTVYMVVPMGWSLAPMYCQWTLGFLLTWFNLVTPGLLHIDDFALFVPRMMAMTAEERQLIVDFIARSLQAFGLPSNAKADLRPVVEKRVLGVLLNTRLKMRFPMADKVDNILSMFEQTLVEPKLQFAVWRELLAKVRSLTQRTDKALTTTMRQAQEELNRAMKLMRKVFPEKEENVLWTKHHSGKRPALENLGQDFMDLIETLSKVNYDLGEEEDHEELILASDASDRESGYVFLSHREGETVLEHTGSESLPRHMQIREPAHRTKASRSSSVRECYGLLQALTTLRRRRVLKKGVKLHIRLDNLGVVYALKNGGSKSDYLHPLIVQVHSFLRNSDIDPIFSWHRRNVGLARWADEYSKGIFQQTPPSPSIRLTKNYIKEVLKKMNLSRHAFRDLRQILAGHEITNTETLLIVWIPLYTTEKHQGRFLEKIDEARNKNFLILIPQSLRSLISSILVYGCQVNRNVNSWERKILIFNETESQLPYKIVGIRR